MIALLRRALRSHDEAESMTPAAPGDDVERMEFLLGLRRRGISDQAVLKAMDEVPREHFVASDFSDKAYADQALPIACGQTISQPYVVAYMTEQLRLEPHHRVLEIGTGSGYQAAILSRLAREVVTVERYRTLAETARAPLAHPLAHAGYSTAHGRREPAFLLVVEQGEPVAQSGPTCVSAMNQREKPPFPRQQQPMPGRTDAMQPKPDHGEDSYRGCNKL